MQARIERIIRHWKAPKILFGILGFTIVLGSVGAVLFDSPFPLVLPAVFLTLFISVVDFKWIFFLLLACLPLSTEFNVSGGLATDLPTEPLMVGLMLLYLIFILGKRSGDLSFLRHPITLLLGLHLLWILVTTITSSLLIVSLKYLLAKIWYVVVFFFLAGLLLKSEQAFKRAFWFFFVSLMLTVVFVLIRHAGYGFTFKDIYQVLHPFYRNHVSYAGIMALFFPVICLAPGWYRTFSWKWWLLVFTIPFLLGAIYLSYTRAAYVSVAVAFLVYFIVRLRLMRYALAGALLVSVLTVGYFVRKNTYLQYAPDFDRTVTHTEFDNLISATYKLEDISTMERLYRWIAGFYMFSEKPVVGFGPGNFVNFYRSYTVTSFKTWVSRNEDQSGIHSYYLMLLAEQGIVGMAIFLLLSFYVLIKGEELYHRVGSARQRRIIMMVLLCTIVIDSFSIINDVVETDKFGPWYFISMAVLVNMDRKGKSRWLDQ